MKAVDAAVLIQTTLNLHRPKSAFMCAHASAVSTFPAYFDTATACTAAPSARRRAYATP